MKLSIHAFSDKQWAERLVSRGTLAEGKFITWAAQRSIEAVRWGFDNPPFREFYKLPLFLRLAPDFVVQGHEFGFVEVKGCGGSVLKLKTETMSGLAEWHAILPVWFFVYDSRHDAFAFIDFESLLVICSKCPTRRFESDNKPYYEVDVTLLTWNPMEKNDERQDQPQGTQHH